MSGVSSGTQHEAPGIGTALLRVAAVLFVGTSPSLIGAGWWQLVQAGPLTDDPRNPLRAWVERNVARGRILDARGALVAGNTPREDGVRGRRYRFPAMATITGYHSALLGTAGLERTYDLQLVGHGRAHGRWRRAAQAARPTRTVRWTWCCRWMRGSSSWRRASWAIARAPWWPSSPRRDASSRS